MDTLSKEKRSWNMSRIKSKDTAPELCVRSLLHRNGYRFRLHVKDLPGKPDIVLPKYKTVIEVRGCFWHQHKNCRYAKIPQVRHDWWLEKLNANAKRDEENQCLLINAGWHILIVWECFLDVHTHTDEQKEELIQKAFEYFSSSNTQIVELSEKNYLHIGASKND